MKVYKSKSGKTTFRKKRIGDLVAMRIADKVVFGWSLCHRRDIYDFVEGRKYPGFGLKMAKTRAMKWSNNPNVEVPHSIRKQFSKFMNRCDKYFKDADYKQGYVFKRHPNYALED